MKDPTMPQAPVLSAEEQERAKYREEYRRQNKEIYANPVDAELPYEDYRAAVYDLMDQETMDEIHALTEDTQHALAYCEEFFTPDYLYKICEIISQNRNSELKLALAKWLDVLTSIQSNISSIKEKPGGVNRAGRIKDTIEYSRKQLEAAIKNCEGEAKDILLDKLQTFNDAVREDEEQDAAAEIVWKQEHTRHGFDGDVKGPYGPPSKPE